mgnify:CR=1 FL=1
MNLAEILVGNNMSAHPDCLGIYIGIDEIYVAQSAKRDSGTVLESLIRVPVNMVDRSKLKAGELNEAFFTQDYWLDALGKVTSKKSWSTTKVVVSLAPEFCLLRHFVISIPMKRQEWSTGIPNEARKYIHFPFDKAAYAYHVYEFETAATKQPRLGVVFAMTTRTIISRLEKGLKTVGLDLLSVESSCLSLARAFSSNDKEAVGDGGRIYSFFGKESASFVFLNGLVPVLEREVEISGSAPAERRRFEIANSAEFIAKQLEKDPFEEAVITGYRMEQWVPALEADSRKAVRKWDLSEVFGIETKAAGEVAAIGASSKFVDQATPDIDFTKGKRLSPYEFNASWTMWKITAVLIVLMLLVLGKSYMGVLFDNFKLQKKSASIDQTLEDFQGLSSSQLQTNLDNIKNQNNALSSVYTNSPLLTPILEAVANTVPENIWLTRISYTAPFPAASKGGGSLTLEGIIRSGKDNVENLLISRRLPELFSKQPALKQLCRDASVRTGGTSNHAADSAKETSFTLTCNAAAAGSRSSSRRTNDGI